MVPALVPCVLHEKKNALLTCLHGSFNQSVNRVEFQKKEKAFPGPGRLVFLHNPR
jgi:hypothetical protein